MKANYSVAIEDGRTAIQKTRRYKVMLPGLSPEEVAEKHAAWLRSLTPSTAIICGMAVQGGLDIEVNPLYEGHPDFENYLGKESAEAAVAAFADFAGGSWQSRDPENRICLGLQEGYGPEGTLHSADELKGLLPEGSKVRVGNPAYGWVSEGKWGTGTEPGVIISLPGTPTLEDCRELCEKLAGFGQVRIYACAEGKTAIFQREDGETPTG